MRPVRMTALTGCLAALVTLAVPSAAAAQGHSLHVGAEPRAARPTERSHAFIRMDVGHKPVWVGQAIPITITAQFRGVEAVTLQGAPQLKSEGIFTADLAREPRQSQQLVDGEPVLVATWTGTITPSTASPLVLSVELPVSIRFRDAVPEPEVAGPIEEDPFGNLMNIDPSDPNSIQRLFRSFDQSFARGLEQPLGLAHEESMTLKAAVRPIEVKALPLTLQPSTFSGAVGHFDVRASLSASQARASEPVTLTVTVQGDGDLDRVSLPGLGTSADFKAYPTSSKVDAQVPGKKLGRKTFEQVLIPLHGGVLTIPAVAFSAFDPILGKYTTTETAPLTLDVEGPPLGATPVAAAPVSPTPNTVSVDHTPAEDTLPPPPPSALLASPRTLAWWLSPVLGLLLVSALYRFRPKSNEEKALRISLRRAAEHGSVSAFFDAARRLIVVHFSKRWGVSEKDVTAEALSAQLGARAAPLVSAISAAEALKFGRRNVDPTELQSVCSSIEESLRDAA